MLLLVLLFVVFREPGVQGTALSRPPSGAGEVGCRYPAENAVISGRLRVVGFGGFGQCNNLVKAITESSEVCHGSLLH